MIVIYFYYDYTWFCFLTLVLCNIKTIEQTEQNKHNRSNSKMTCKDVLDSYLSGPKTLLNLFNIN